MTLQSKSIQIVGPYFTNYSLAQVNRNLAWAIRSLLGKDVDLWLWCPEDRIDYLPTSKQLENSQLSKLVSFKKKRSDIVIFNNTPRESDGLYGLDSLPGDIIIPYLAWEESIFPKRLVEEINQFAHALMVTSTFVYHIMKNSGVKIPIFNISEGVDREFSSLKIEKVKLKTKKKFKFFHASTGRARKGVDVLLKAYFKSFTKRDDCVLICKTFPNPNNLIPQFIENLKKEDSPEVELIDRTDLTAGQMKFLTKTSNCCVYPSRAEGFGLPMAEAMYCKVPLITTAYGGVLDFANEDNAFLIDFDMSYAHQSESDNIGARWAEPSVDILAKIMRDIYEGNIEDLERKVDNAKKRADFLTWENVAKRLFEVLDKIDGVNKHKTKKHAIITPINSQDGIAEYTRHIYQSCEKNFQSIFFLSNKDIADRVRMDKKNVYRVWNMGTDDIDDVIDKIKELSVDSVHIQYHSGAYFSPTTLDLLLKKLYSTKKIIVLELHAVKSASFDISKMCKNFNLATHIIVHSKKDAEYLKKQLSNIVYEPLGEKVFYPRAKFKVKKDLKLDSFFPIIATHGLFNKNKNIPNVVKAFAQVLKDYPNALFLGLNAISPNNVYAQSEYNSTLKIANELNIQDRVIIITDFLEREELEIYASCVDCFVLPYEHVGESASGAVRTCMASGAVVLVSDIEQFSDFEDEVVKLDNISSEEIYAKIIEVMSNSDIRSNIIKSSKQTLSKMTYDKLALDFLSLLK
jgi:glycosyltransferase involved in cell wall biosynthesis